MNPNLLQMLQQAFAARQGGAAQLPWARGTAVPRPQAGGGDLMSMLRQAFAGAQARRAAVPAPPQQQPWAKPQMPASPQSTTTVTPLIPLNTLSNPLPQSRNFAAQPQMPAARPQSAPALSRPTTTVMPLHTARPSAPSPTSRFAAFKG
mgnify:CR=1 FL=1